MGYRDLTAWEGNRIVAPVMAVRAIYPTLMHGFLQLGRFPRGQNIYNTRYDLRLHLAEVIWWYIDGPRQTLLTPETNTHGFVLSRSSDQKRALLAATRRGGWLGGDKAMTLTDPEVTLTFLPASITFLSSLIASLTIGLTEFGSHAKCHSNTRHIRWLSSSVETGIFRDYCVMPWLIFSPGHQ